MRLSTYNILIKAENKNIILNSLWRTIDEIEDEIYFAIQNNALNDIPDGIQKELLSRGYLTTFSAEKEAKIVTNIIKKSYAKQKNAKHRSYTIILSYNCNFRCPYCFEKEIQKKGSNYIENKMNKDMVDVVCGFIDSNPPKSKTITIYGGEPFIKENEENLKYLIEKLTENHKLIFISNGFEIDYFIDLLNEMNTSFIQISCDGSRFFHDKTRKSYQGEATFDKIMSNIQLLIKKKIAVNLRINCTRNTIHSLKELHETLSKYDFYRSTLFSISYSPIIDFFDKRKGIELEMTDYIQEIELLNDYGKSQGFVEGSYIHYYFRDFFRNSLLNRKSLPIQPVVCNAYTHSCVLDPFGKIYPCWDVTDQPEHCIGTFYPEITKNEEIIDKWHNRENVIIEKCIQCPYVLYCGGGCAIKAKLKNGKFDDVECDSFPEIFKRHFLYEYNAAHPSLSAIASISQTGVDVAPQMPIVL